jgi:hypothetical protein
MNNLNDNNVMNNSIGIMNGRIKFYLSIIFISYFLVKAIFASFDYYPDKFYNRSFTIKSNKKGEYQTAIQSFIPGVWNSELNDLVITLILVIVIFFFKSDTNFPLMGNSYANFMLWGSFFFGLLIEPFRTIVREEGEKEYNLFTFIILLIIGILFLVTTIIGLYSSHNKGKNEFLRYLLYTIVFVITFTLLFIFRKKSNSFISLLYNVEKADKESCKSLDSTPITVKTSGEKFNPNLAFITFLILLFIPMVNNSKLLNVVTGLLLGIFVGSMSFVGIEFPLRREPGEYCLTENKADCLSKGIPDITGKKLDLNLKTKNIINSLTNRVRMNTWTTMGISVIVLIVIILISLRIIYE